MPGTWKIIDLVRQFDSGKIQLPIMQRDYVWKAKQVIKLMDSLYKKWPIGSFYLWESRKEQELKGNSVVPPHYYLLDGQQRLTSISKAIKQGTDDMSSKMFFDVLRDENDSKKFVMGQKLERTINRLDAGDPTLVPLSTLVLHSSGDAVTVGPILKKMIDGNKIKEHECDRIEKKLEKVKEMFNSDATIGTVEQENVEDAIEIFARLNSGGTKLKSGDIQVAQLAQEQTASILPEMRKFMMTTENQALGYDFAFLTRCLVTMHRDSAKLLSQTERASTFFADRDGKTVKDTWRTTAKCLKNVIKFVRNEMGWATRRWLPSANALIPVTYLIQYNHGSRITNKDKNPIKTFLSISALRKLFSGAVDTTINRYVRAIKNAKSDERNADLFLRKISTREKYPVTKEDILKESRMTSPLMQVYLAYLVSKDAKSWLSGLSLSDVAKSSEDLEVHHIFPKQFLAENEMPTAKANTMANYAFLSKGDNVDLGAESPKVEYNKLGANQKEYAALQSIMVGRDDLLELNAYDAFCERRSEDIANKLNRFLGLKD